MGGWAEWRKQEVTSWVRLAGACVLQSRGCFPSEAPHPECHSLKLTVISLCDRKSFVREFNFFPFFFSSEKRERNWEISGEEVTRGKGRKWTHTHRSRERQRERNRRRERE